MTKFHGFFCNVRQFFCFLHNFLLKKYFTVFFSDIAKSWQKQKSKNKKWRLPLLDSSENLFELRKLR